VKNTLNKYRKGILDNLILKKLPSIEDNNLEKTSKINDSNDVSSDNKDEKDEKNIKLIRFLHSVPQFIGDDLILYGPFENEDVASLPIDIANLLIKKNKAEGINPS
jgi:hypothetical protein